MAVKFFFLLTLTVMVDSLKLEKVFIFSRHNVRTPLNKNLERATSLEWPSWDKTVGHLTDKGRLLEEIMGGYFSLWFESKGLFTTKCPDPDSVFIYANNLQRTVETAKEFARAAFKDCNMSVHHDATRNISGVGVKDPVFAPILRNSSESFIEICRRNIQEKINNLQLEDAYELLNRIVDITNSDICKHESFCDFNMKENDILLTVAEEPDVDGPLAIGNFIVDSFLMSYYNGRPEEEIAWGKLKTEEDWQKLLEITRANQYVRFQQPRCDLLRPMLNFIRESLLNERLGRKLTVMVGHDSNLSSLMATLGFKKYNLQGQYELTPVGGKLVFQKWRDEDQNVYLKTEYIYASMKQLRNGTVLTLENPPFSKVMEMENCEIDVNGFCPWSDFVKKLGW